MTKFKGGSILRAPTPKMCECQRGWHVNGETNRVERCDACGVFETDDQAADWVHEVVASVPVQYWESRGVGSGWVEAAHYLMNHPGEVWELVGKMS